MSEEKAIGSGGKPREQQGAMRRSLVEQLKLAAWALMLVYLILFGLALRFANDVGYETALHACLGVAALTTAAFVAIYLCDLLRIVIADRLDKGRRKQGI